MLSKKKNGLRVARCETAVIPHSARSLPSNVSIGGTPKSKGFTLIEIIVVIVIIGIISTIAAMIIMQGVRMYADEQSRSDVHYQAKLAMERMAREIRMIRSRTAADIPIMNGTTLMYNDINGVQMGFRLNGTDIERTQDNGATWQQLATNITGPIFTYLDTAGVGGATATTLWLVQMQFTATQGTQSIAMRTTVHPRKF